jgi:membrane protease subunit (stomatin/prohibitin family)
VVLRTSLIRANSTKKQKSNANNKQKGEAKSKNDNKCHRCGTYSHFAKDCRTPKHLVALYQKSLKEAKQGKTN